MDGKYSVVDVAGYVVEYCNEKDLSISNLRLQKLLYFIQAYFLVKSDGKRVAFNEDLEAWDFGPVVPCIYYQYKRFGSGQIPFNDKSYANIFSDEDRKIIEDVIEHFKEKSSIYLMELTHNQKPWNQVYYKGERYSNLIIDKDSIKDYFLHKQN